MMEDLKHLGENVYMAYGKVVLIKDSSVNPDTEDGCREVLAFTEKLFDGDMSPRPWEQLHGRRHASHGRRAERQETRGATPPFQRVAG